jgi:hypothetical protein
MVRNLLSRTADDPYHPHVGGDLAGVHSRERVAMREMS